MVELIESDTSNSDQRLVADWEDHHTKAYGCEDPRVLKKASPDTELNIIVVITFSLERETSDTIGEKWEQVQEKRDL